MKQYNVTQVTLYYRWYVKDLNSPQYLIGCKSATCVDMFVKESK